MVLFDVVWLCFLDGDEAFDTCFSVFVDAEVPCHDRFVWVGFACEERDPVEDAVACDGEPCLFLYIFADMFDVFLCHAFFLDVEAVDESVHGFKSMSLCDVTALYKVFSGVGADCHVGFCESHFELSVAEVPVATYEDAFEGCDARAVFLWVFCFVCFSSVHYGLEDVCEEPCLGVHGHRYVGCVVSGLCI